MQNTQETLAITVRGHSIPVFAQEGRYPDGLKKVELRLAKQMQGKAAYIPVGHPVACLSVDPGRNDLPEGAFYFNCGCPDGEKAYTELVGKGIIFPAFDFPAIMNASGQVAFPVWLAWTRPEVTDPAQAELYNSLQSLAQLLSPKPSNE